MDSTTQFESTQSQIDWYIKEAGKLMYQSIDKENLKDFEEIELELRDRKDSHPPLLRCNKTP